MQDAQKDIASLLPEELSAELREMGEAPFRAKQVFDWLSKGVWEFGEMSNLPLSLRTKLAERFFLAAPQVMRKQVSQTDGTVKYLWKLRDGNAVESVVMRYSYGNTVCISSQVGCRQGCVFCASGNYSNSMAATGFSPGNPSTERTAAFRTVFIHAA